jgi:hypothetical protein
MGKQFHNTKPLIALAISKKATTRRGNLPLDDVQTPNANASTMREYTEKSGTTKLLVGASIEKSSLTA